MKSASEARVSPKFWHTIPLPLEHWSAVRTELDFIHASKDIHENRLKKLQKYDSSFFPVQELPYNEALEGHRPTLDEYPSIVGH